MQLKFTIPIYKEAPFVRLFVALSVGILVQWFLPISTKAILIIGLFLILSFIFFSFFVKDKIVITSIIKSTIIQFLIILFGAVLVQINNVKLSKNYFAKKITTVNYKTIVALNEPLSEKSKSFKAVGNIISIINNDTIINAEGKVILYFKKDSFPNNLKYGNTILINKQLQKVKNSGNPGAFKYDQQCFFQGITHQVFLSNADYINLPEKHTTFLNSFLYSLRTNVLNIIDKNIEPIKEKGVAEALLIGYRDDLDKDLNQAYSNTGTIHVIAISGLHLGFIYAILVLVFKPFEKRKWIMNWIKPIVIILILWIFSLVAGGAASILRSAIMFTCIVIGDCINRKTSIYNTLAASAFIILCINPFSLWDVGFQLSYAAVLSIVIFMQPIYKLFYFKNKYINTFWQINAVTISAQILTIPISIFHFHQFPNLFLITNLVAIPLSTLILGVELLLIVFGWWHWLATFIGKVTYWLIWAMDSYIEWCNHFWFAITDYLQINAWQCILFYVIIIGIGYWLLQKNNKGVFASLVILILLLSTNIIYQQKINNQQKLVVYNIPNEQAIDFVKGNSYEFIGDSIMQVDGFYKNFHLKPARVEFGTKTNEAILSLNNAPFYHFANKNILLLQNKYNYINIDSFKTIDFVVASKNPKLYIDSLAKIFSIKQFVADASNPNWKVKLWKKDCERLKIPFYSTIENGAFVIDF